VTIRLASPQGDEAVPIRGLHWLRRTGAASSDNDLAGRKNLLLLVQLRWIAIGGQLVTLAFVYGVWRADLPVRAIAGVVAALLVLNLASLLRLRSALGVSNAELFGTLCFDVFALTAQLYFTGGARNPFAFLFLLQVTLGAVLLDLWSTWALVALTCLCLAGLTVVYRPLDLIDQQGPGSFPLSILGLVICFALNAALLVTFITRINRNLRERDTRLADLRQQAAEEDHVVRMGLLASGAAHELGTPLATLSVILSDWNRMPALTDDPELRQEIDSMQGQVQRCKAIVTRVLLAAGEPRGESAGITTLQVFLQKLVADWQAVHPDANLSYDSRLGEDLPIAWDTALQQVIFNVLDNAHEVSPHWVGFTASQDRDSLILEVSDLGPGFAPDMLKQVGRPHRSTKGREERGLGLFLVTNVLRKLGGSLSARNRPKHGAIVTMTLPLSALAIDAEALS
jgi:two-component system sensor histidine kinase RegB